MAQCLADPRPGTSDDPLGDYTLQGRSLWTLWERLQSVAESLTWWREVEDVRLPSMCLAGQPCHYPSHLGSLRWTCHRDCGNDDCGRGALVGTEREVLVIGKEVI